MPQTGQPAFLLQATDMRPLRESRHQVDIAVLGGSALALAADGTGFVNRFARMLAGLEKPWCGRICLGRGGVGAFDRAARRLVGFVPERLEAAPGMTPRGYLTLLSAAAGAGGRKAQGASLETLKWFGIDQYSGTPVERLPGDVRYAVGFAGALIHNPSVVIAQGPVPELVFRQLEDLKAVDKALVLCCDGVAGIPPCSDRIALCSDTDLVRTVPAGELARLCSSSSEIRVSFHPPLQRRLMEEIPGLVSLTSIEGGWSLRHSSPAAAIGAISALARANSRMISSFSIRHPSVSALIRLSEEDFEPGQPDLFGRVEEP